MDITGKDILIGFLIFGMFMVGYGIMMGDVAENYNVSTEEFNMSIYDKINETYATTMSMTQETRGISGNTSTSTGTDEDRYYRVLKNSLTSVLMIFDVLDYVPAIINDLGGEFYIPLFIISTIIAIIFVVILWAIWKIFHRS